MKSILKIIIILLVLGLIGYGTYWFFSQREAGAPSPFSDGVSVGDFFPFGTGSNIATGTPTTGDTTLVQNTGTPIPTASLRLWQISSEPQSGAIAYTASNTPIVRYVDKATGNIFESKLTLTGSNRISNTTIPKVYDSLWQKDGMALVMRYLSSDRETIKSVYGKLTSGTPTAEGSFRELKTSFLPDNIQSFSVEPTSGTLAYLTTNDTGSRVFVSTATNPKQIYDSVIKDFSISWVNKTTLALSSKPSATTAGQFYFLRSDNSLLSRVLSGPLGLLALANPAATQVIYSESTNTGFKTSLFDTKTGAINTLTISTLADKCVWSSKTTSVFCAVPKLIPSGQYPDSWYQGKVSFDDSIWQIDTLTGTTKLIIDPETLDHHLDAVNLMLDTNEQYIVFTNKKDSSLWGLKI